jgi:glycosyltransferase involved in cell wall biosynthesis
MRILHLSALYPPYIVGGAERSVEHLAEEQVAMGHTVAAACIDREGAAAVERHGVSVYRMPHHNAFWLEDWPKHSQMERNWAKMKQQWNFAVAAEFGKVIDDFKPDIINTHSLLDVSTLVWRAAKQRNIPIVHTVCEYDLICGNAAMFRHGKPCDHWHLQCQVVSFTKRLNSRLVDGLTCVGTEIMKTHVEHGYFTHLPESRRRVIFYSCTVPGGDPEDRKTIDREGKPMVFGYIGRINVEKGVGTIIDAFRRIAAEKGYGDNWKCLVAGAAMDGSLETFKTQAEGLPIEFVGFVNPKDFFLDIDVLICPSIWAEPSPRTIYEAYAMHVPCIGSRSGGIPELIGEDNDAWLFNGGDDAALADRIRSVLDKGREGLPDPASYQWVVEESKSRRVGENFVALYEDILGAGSQLAAAAE